MDSIINAILKVIPFSKFFESQGFSKEVSAAIPVIIAAILLYQIIPWLKIIYAYYNNTKTAKDLAPYFEYSKVKQSRDLFIPTHFQNNSPTNEDEPSFTHRFVSKSKLIPFFLKKVFNEKNDTDKFYLILADSGMGKTTFMINLYMQYNSYFNFLRKYKIKLLPFGDNRIIDMLKMITHAEARNTILLLDAFDEYKGLLPPDFPDGLTDDERFRKCLDEIIEYTRDFREVLITSRTQYFPGQENQAYELKVPRFDDKGYHTLAKLYLSPFDDKEVKQYLNKKYGWFSVWNLHKKNLAKKIVKSSPKLMVRPMLLAYIDYLVDSNKLFSTTFQIYETLIEKWIEREANKRKYDTPTRNKFKHDLFLFSELTALEIYHAKKLKGNFSINKETAAELCNQNQINLEDYEITGQSLLTRDITHNWKFSHKSIFEFFLAKKCFDDIDFASTFEFTGMDMVKTFYEEVIPGYFKLIKGGTYKFGNEFPVKINDFYMSKYQVTQAEYLRVTGKDNPSDFKGSSNPVERVSWFDATEYCNMLNLVVGYKEVYDKSGNLLDSTGKITSDIQKVRGFRLPTEAEWEFAAGGGLENRTVFSGTNDEHDLDEYAWYKKNDVGRTHPVGKLKPNILGLNDMSGNVFEWCTDWYDADFYKKTNKIFVNPLNSYEGLLSHRVFRGGGFYFAAQYCRVIHRNHDEPKHFGVSLGFRLVFTK